MPFQLIPVVDLQSGLVVHARRGNRAAYLPLESALCKGSLAIDVVAALLELHDFPALYIADLDAIQRRSDNREAIENIRRNFPSLALWIDSGIADIDTFLAWKARGWGRAVIGSEVLVDAGTASELLNRANQSVLSLDFRGNRFVGPPGLLGSPDDWPRQVIAMTLDRVGASGGPDLERISGLAMKAGGRCVYAAGGVRNAEDIEAIARCGATGVLLATALHEKRLDHAALARLANLSGTGT